MNFRMTPTMLHSIDGGGCITEVSELWLTKLGYARDEVVGRPSTDFLSDASARYAREVVLPKFYATGACDAEYEMKRKDGGVMPVRLHAVALRDEAGAFERSIAVIEDMTEQRALETKMFEAQKLECLGLMAGSIAHDFNNLLSSVVGNVQIAVRAAGHLAPAAAALADIMTAATRAADLCRELLAYSGRGRFHDESIDLNDLVVELVKVLAVNVGDRASLALDLVPESALVEVDATQVRQVLMNLVVNAVEAMDSRRGTVTIRTGYRELDETALSASSRPDAAPGRYVVLEVADTGHGIDAAAMTQIFEPFYSTKGLGRGLGLAAVHGIVRGHHGTLVVASEPGRGTTFSVFLPVASGALPARTTGEQNAFSCGTVLVVDDDELVRRTLATQLELVGYRVLQAGSGDEAIALARTSEPGAFLVDVTMPGLSGPDLATRLHGERPSARVVLMSGYNAVDMPSGGWSRFLMKPFTEDELLRAIGHEATVAAG